MAEKKEFTINAVRREGRGKNDARRLRASGKVPLTIYGGEGDSVSASASLAELAAILRTESGHNTIFTLDVDGEGGHDVMFLDRQIDPVRGRLVHADLRRLVRGPEPGHQVFVVAQHLLATSARDHDDVRVRDVVDGGVGHDADTP